MRIEARNMSRYFPGRATSSLIGKLTPLAQFQQRSFALVCSQRRLKRHPSLRHYPSFGIGRNGAQVGARREAARLVGSSKKDFLAFPSSVKEEMDAALGVAQFGRKHTSAKPWKGQGRAYWRSSRFRRSREEGFRRPPASERTDSPPPLRGSCGGGLGRGVGPCSSGCAPPRSQTGKRGATPHPNPPPQGGRERYGAGRPEPINRKSRGGRIALRRAPEPLPRQRVRGRAPDGLWIASSLRASQ